MKLNINLPKLIESRLVLQANSGGGKSWAARWLIETFFSRVQIIVIDPEGEFGNMRGEYDFVYIGKDGDAPAEVRSATLLAKRLLETRASAIVDIYEMNMSERRDFVRLFLTAMVDAPKELWHDCLVFLDEAHKFAPEKEHSQALEAVADMASRGRKRGYCLIPITQRPAKLNKDVAAECNNKLIGRASLDIDRKRSAEELGFYSKEEVLSLRNLEPGEFYAFGPAISRDVVKTTIGDVRVKPPKRGVIRNKPPAPTEKVKKILAQFKDLPQEAKKEALTTQELRQELLILKSHKCPKVIESDPEETKKLVEKFVLKAKIEVEKSFDDELRRFKKKVVSIKHSLIGIAKVMPELLKVVSDIEGDTVSNIPTPKFDLPLIAKPVIPRNIPQNVVPVFSGDFPNTPIGRCERKIYTFLSINSEKFFSKVQIGAVTGYSPSSGGFNNAIGKLNSLGLLNKSGSNIGKGGNAPELLIEGETFSAEPSFWANKLGRCEREIYQWLWNNGEAHTKEVIGEATNYSPSSGGFNNAIGRLNSIGLIRRENGLLRINPELLNI